MIFLRVSQIFFSLLLLASSAGKFFDMLGFYGVVQSYQLLPAVLVPIGAWLLAMTELLVCIMLATSNLRPQSLNARNATRRVIQLLIALHVFFLLGVASAYLRDLVLPNCGCFGVYWPRPLTHWSIVEDLVLTTWAVMFYREFMARTNRLKPGKIT